MTKVTNEGPVTSAILLGHVEGPGRRRVRLIYWFGKPCLGSLQVSSPSANKGQRRDKARQFPGLGCFGDSYTNPPSFQSDPNQWCPFLLHQRGRGSTRM